MSNQPLGLLRLSRKKRSLTSKDYQTLLKTGRRINTTFFSVWLKENTLEKARLGIIISKKQINTAVKRNRVKRKIREYFRIHQSSLSHMDMVFMVYKGILTADASELELQLGYLWKKIENIHKK